MKILLLLIIMLYSTKKKIIYEIENKRLSVILFGNVYSINGVMLSLLVPEKCRFLS